MDNWNNDSIQFPRLLSEILAAGLPDETLDELSISMDLERDEILEILNRADRQFEKIKQQRVPPGISDGYKVLDVKFSFETWMKDGKSIYGTPEDLRIGLSLGAFHSGTVFQGTIKVPASEVTMLQEALNSMATPVMAVFKIEEIE
jgi:hypothetical protein